MPSTIREVAERARVSVSTVSRVLNDYPFVSEDARGRVLDAMGELDYRPDVAARTMRTGTSLAVGFVVADIANPLFSAIAKGADEVLHEHGYSLVLANSQNDPDREAALVSALRQRRVDGLIAAVADERVPGLAARLAQFPGCVLFDREVDGSSADAVLSDHANGLEQALSHLASLGHRRIACVGGLQGQLGSRARVTAFRRIARGLGLAGSRDLVRTVQPNRERAQGLARELLALPEPPTAVVIAHNQLTVGVLEAVRGLGIRVPDGLSLVACDDVDVTRLHEPPIGVIERDLIDHGKAAAQLLLERFEGRGGPPQARVLATRFEARASTAVPAARLTEARTA